jgi:hypothetical protein
MYLTETIEANVYIFLFTDFASGISSFSPFFTGMAYYVHPSTYNFNSTYMGNLACYCKKRHLWEHRYIFFNSLQTEY